MNILIRLSPRLESLAVLVKKTQLTGRHTTLADIGSDHAYLPAFLLQEKIIGKGIAADIHDGPYKNSLRTIDLYGLEDCLEARLGDGLSELDPGEVQILVLAGMGGATIEKILLTGDAVAREAHCLILQPQNAWDRLCFFLTAQGWFLDDEALVEENQEIYRLMAWRRKQTATVPMAMTTVPVMEDQKVPDIELMINRWHRQVSPESDRKVFARSVWFLGPVNIARRTDLLKPLIHKELTRLSRTSEDLGKSRREESRGKFQELAEEIKVWEDLLTWLFP
jgi:tRNA (adenine22-N1)-methyltransferase